jgi:predicted HicB family RNase H-like nuclease
LRAAIIHPVAERARQMDYRGYTGTVEYDAVEGIFFGCVMGLKDTITYEAPREELLEAAFRDAVDEYLDQCRACEEEPERPPSTLRAAA